jgi:preprotein translocase subunit SecG
MDMAKFLMWLVVLWMAVALVMAIAREPVAEYLQETSVDTN